MVRICVVTGSRADWGPLEWLVKKLKEDSFFEVTVLNIWGMSFTEASQAEFDCDLLLVLGDRFEILAVVIQAHLKRIPIAHIGGGDVTEGSYDDAMRDAISRMASIHFVTSTFSMARLSHFGFRNVHLVGSPGIDYIRHAEWRGSRDKKLEGYELLEITPLPYVVVSYQPETIDGTIDLEAVNKAIAGRKAIWIAPNPDKGSELIPKGQTFSHDEFLRLIEGCEEFIGNSSSMLYEAPELGVKTHMIGKRQKGRVIPWGDGYASKRIIKILKYGSF